MLKHLKQQVKTINKVFRGFDMRDSKILVNDCVKTISEGHQIIITALGKNEYISNKFSATLKSLGLNSHFINTNSAVHGDMGLIKPEDLVIMLSKSGETNETIYFAKLLKKRVTNNWLITCNKNCTASKHVTNIIFLQIDHEGDPWNVIPHNSIIVFLIFLQALTMELIDQLKIPLSVFKKNHPSGGIGKVLKHVR